MADQHKSLDLSSTSNWSWLNQFIRKNAGEFS
jgi:hypothetical protein